MRGQIDAELLDAVRRSVLSTPGPVTPARVAAALQSSGRVLGTAGALAAVETIMAELRGLGPLQVLANDPAVTDLFVNAPESVWLDRGHGLERSAVSFPSEEALRALAVRLVAAAGRRLDDSSPCVDVRLPGGYRVHAVLPPVSTGGTLLSIRIRRARPMTLDELEAAGTVLPDQRTVLEALVAQRRSFLVSGSTGSGKTTLLSTLLGLVPSGDRIVLVEDAAELVPDHGHAVGLEARHGNVEGAGGVDLGRLVREALRMRPDWLVVGECRGAEVRDLLSALNTGHSGAGTVHANAAASVVARLAALGALAGLTREATFLQASSALDAVVHLERAPEGRRVASIAVVTQGPDGLTVTDALRRVSGTARASEPGPGWVRLAAELALPRALGAAA
ncbi:TadA family conjugal transfer-associated ATPase [Sinomonas atrocyanea]|uniref:TadA family conjugal transfer-associated ATPase n=1 Tax=Sinomonas atrocyanea TaxID=37927 RepID=UPI0027862140|nr:TadA family conjugal transfer-associated ATPase [Sinomonas atrocyanea]MDQ0259038.1 pilus assembly protein CpaF [Sinomonas atrocyanea]MDR6621855.1 pilus assembly protein CpaF [Sinomonas atrocyanea]